MTRRQEQERDWEELSRLREENRLLREQLADLKQKIDTLIKKYTHSTKIQDL